jgi:hypothetical protein
VTRARLRLVLALGLALACLTTPPAGAHGGDNLARPIVERVTPDVPGLEVQVTYSANYQFLLKNPSPTELTVMADSGEPFIRIGPEGVFGNYRSPSWYNSNVPDGLQKFPDQAKPGADVPPEWRKVAREPSWGWYDHRLHPVERYVPKKVQDAGKVATLGHWKVPIRYGTETGGIQGRFEYKPSLGTYRQVLKSPENITDGVKVQVISVRTVPAMYLENTSSTPVVVLGKENEPFVRIGPKAEVNLTSPSYVEMLQAQGLTPTMPADAAAPPTWQEKQSTPRWSWLEFRARSPQKEPKKEIAQRDTPTTVDTWKVPVLIGSKRTDIEGITEFVPIARLRAEASGATKKDEGGASSKLPLYAGIGLATVAVSFFLLRPRKQAPKAEPEVRHRSRATPKARR